MEKTNLVRLAEVFDVLPYSIPTIRVYASKGIIPCYKVGKRYYVNMDEIKEYAKSLIVRVGGNHVNQSNLNQ